MLRIINNNSTLILFIGIVFLLQGCKSNNIEKSILSVIEKNSRNEIIIQPMDSLYLNWLSTSGNKNISWKWILRVKENGKVKEYYSDEIYFMGTISENGIKTGIWEGYVKNKLVIKTSYPGSSSNNSPMFVKIMDSQGKLIKELNFSIVN